MTETYKQLAQATSSTSNTSIYEVPESSEAIASVVSLLNTGATAEYSLALVPESEYQGIISSVPGGPLKSQLGQRISGSAAYYQLGLNAAFSGDGNTMAVFYFTSGEENVIVYSFDGTSWVQKGTPFHGPTVTGQQNSMYGFRSMALSEDGNTMVIGAPLYNSYEGAFYVYSWVPIMGGYWNLVDAPVVGLAGELLGYSVDISDSGLVVAAASRDYDGNVSNIGGVYVYEYSSPLDGTKSLRGGSAVTAPNSDSAGVHAVSISGDGTTLAFASTSKQISFNTDGAVYTAKWNGSQWVSFTETSAPVDGDREFGSGLALSQNGSVLAIGGQRPKGTLDVFTWTGSSWSRIGTRKDGVIGDNLPAFYSNVDISDDGLRIVFGAGAYYQSALYIYDYDGSDWIELYQRESESYGLGSNAHISNDGSRIIVSRPQAPFNGALSGAIDVYALTNNPSTQSLTPANKHFIIKSKQIASGEHFEFSGGLSMSSGDHLIFVSDSSDVVINVSGVEIS